MPRVQEQLTEVWLIFQVLVTCFHVFNFCQNCIYKYEQEIFILLYFSLNSVAVDGLDIWFNTAGVLRQRICFAASFVKDAN